jgi:D-serine deaminase-like pyridoxal phosphate-dependent protein
MTDKNSQNPSPDWVNQFFEFEDVGHSLAALETPVPVIDLDIVVRNLVTWQAHCDQQGLANRPHIKTHKLVPLAKLQLALGAKGICVQKLGEAEVMAQAGLDDQLLTFNVVGAAKLARLADLRKRIDISVVADSDIVVAGLAQAAKDAGRALHVLVECDTGAGRNGVQSPFAALALAQLIDKSPGLVFAGLMTYPPTFARSSISTFIAETKMLLQKSGLACGVVTSGGSRDMWSAEGLVDVTEYRVGTYIYNDRAQVAAGACSFDDCAETVLTTVVSAPTEQRAIVDAGSKALTSDLSGLLGFGIVRDLNDALLYQLNEEHGYLDTSTSQRRPKVGELLRVTMNHVCPVNNLFDKIVFVRGETVLGAVKVDARGRVQ